MKILNNEAIGELFQIVGAMISQCSYELQEQQSLGGGGGEGENGWKNPARRKADRANELHDQCSQLLGMSMPKTADLRHLRCS